MTPGPGGSWLISQVPGVCSQGPWLSACLLTLLPQGVQVAPTTLRSAGVGFSYSIAWPGLGSAACWQLVPLNKLTLG